jgi:F420H(2)-dependent quinone reductase
MPLDGQYEPSPDKRAREQVELYESSGGTQGLTLRGKPVVIVTTKGAKSGRLRKIPLMRVEHEGSYAIVASQGGAPKHPVWYFNLVVHPRVELQDGPAKQDMTSRELAGEEKAVWWERAVAAWPDYAAYQKRTDREIPVFVLEPVSS